MNPPATTTDAAAARQAPRLPRSSLTFYHPNGKGTGAAAELELRLNRGDETRYDCFFLEMAAQKTQAVLQGDARKPATFDWAAKVTVKLGFLDVCELLLVLEGRAASAGGARNGLYHESGATNTIISLKKNPEGAGFYLGVSRKDKQGGAVWRGSLLLTEAEAVGLRCVLQSGLFFLTFHRSLREPARS